MLRLNKAHKSFLSQHGSKVPEAFKAQTGELVRSDVAVVFCFVLTVKMSPCFCFIRLINLEASFPNSSAWPNQGMIPLSRGGSFFDLKRR